MDAPPASRWLTNNESGGDSRSLLWRLEKALELENSFPSCLRMPTLSKDTEEITLGMRNGCAQVLRCLKVWYDLPSEVLFLATTHLDHFLSRMKVRPKHLSVIALSCFHLAARQVACDMEDCNDSLLTYGTTPFNVPDPRDLLVISQCRCSLGDLSRMEAIVSEKLSVPSSQGKSSAMKPPNTGSMVEKECSTSLSVHQDVSTSKPTSYQQSTTCPVLPKESSLPPNRHPIAGRPQYSNFQTPFPNPPLPLCPITPASFLHLFHSLMNAEVSKTKDNGTWSIGKISEWLAQVSPLRLLHHLEAIACDGSLSCFRASEVALSLMCVMLDQILGSITCLSSPASYNSSRQTQPLWMLSCAMDIQKLCKITDARFTRCHSAVLTVVGYYESQRDASRWGRSDGSSANDEDEDEMSMDEDDEEERNIHGWRRHSYSRRRRRPGAYVEGWGPLAWRVSQRTLRNLRPTEKLIACPPMPTIHEYSLTGRIRSCSLSSEESSDPGEEEEEGEAQKTPERPGEWRVSVSPHRWSTMNPLLEEEGGEE